MATDDIEELSGQSEMFAGNAPGRADSAAAFGRLFDIASIPMIPATASIADCFQGVYKAWISAIRPLWNTKEKAIQAFATDDSMMGVVVDPGSGKVQLDKNVLPSPFEVKIDVKDRDPFSKQQRINELKEHFKMEIIDPFDYRVHVWREGLDLPVGNWAEEAQVRKSMLNNLIMFGDGETPGEIITSDRADNPKVQLRILEQFMARPEYSLASVAVREKFETYKEGLMGLRLLGDPNMPYIEDAAAEEMGQGPAPGGMEMGGMGAPPGMPEEAMVPEGPGPPS
jgi:hypothetical protein